MLKTKIIAIIGFTAILLTGCGTVNVASKWADSYITVDGVDDEWQNGSYYVKDHNLLLGIKNDEENFYFALITSDETNKQQILRGGLTLWFDNEGGSDKKFGVRFPLGMKAPEMNLDKNKPASGLSGMEENGNEQGMPPGGQSGQQNGPGQNGAPTPDFSKMEASFTELEILGEKDTSRMSVDGAKGIAVKMKVIDDKLVYEFKIPLKKTDASSYAIDINKDNEFSLGIETSVSNEKGGKGGPGGDMPEGGDMSGGGPGGMPPGGGGQGGGPGGMPPGGGRGGRGPGGSTSQEPLSYWLNVILAHK